MLFNKSSMIIVNYIHENYCKTYKAPFVNSFMEFLLTLRRYYASEKSFGIERIISLIVSSS